jgi:hypothetical protein
LFSLLGWKNTEKLNILYGHNCATNEKEESDFCTPGHPVPTLKYPG